MFSRYRQRQPGASLFHLVRWSLFSVLLWLWLTLCYRFRTWGVGRIPRTGPILFVSNHQSFMDLAAIGASSGVRHFYALARLSLFDSRTFCWLFAPYNTVALARGESDIKAMRRGIELLDQGQALLLYPEGTRNTDGPVAPFRPGMMLIVKRSRPLVVPVAVEGTGAAWPRDKAMPRPFGRIGIEFGEPIPAQQLLDMGTDEALEHLRTTVETMRRQIFQRTHADEGK